MEGRLAVRRYGRELLKAVVAAALAGGAAMALGQTQTDPRMAPSSVPPALPSAPPSQAGAPLPPHRDEPRPCRLKSLGVCARHVVEDEKGILLSPLRAPAYNLLWIVPLGVGTGVTIHYDTGMIQDLGVDATRENDFEKISTDGGLYLPWAAAGVGYFVGEQRNDRNLTDTAVLAAEAMADATILDEGLKYAIDREGPMLDNARGHLWPQGISGWPNSPSMPSEHAMNVWSFAHVVAGQYNGIATRALVYGLATTVSASRVIARQHFPSDVIVGSTVGWLVGGYVLHHRSPEVGKLLDVSAVQTPMGRGVELRWNLGRGQ
ncbi:MAG TPA: phosphatase PAP2 family protein [Acidobacteriaceae bacterium]|nr:phosphatase PAP2 family protein [Acidobacteriaceae bacterium]